VTVSVSFTACMCTCVCVRVHVHMRRLATGPLGSCRRIHLSRVRANVAGGIVGNKGGSGGGGQWVTGG